MATPASPGDRAGTAALDGTNDPGLSGEARDSLLAIVRDISEISSLPSVALRVMEVAGDPNAGASDLKAVVEADPALCIRVLRCVNSASFGLRTPLEDLNQAVTYLGFRQIRDLAITATISDLFRTGEIIHTYRRKDLWRHMVAVGVCARMIAGRTRAAGFENAFLAGLLHDVGIVLFDQHRHDDFRRVMMGLMSSRPLVESERHLVGWDHTQLGWEVARAWKLPDAPVAAIRWHHDPAAYEGPHRAVVHCVAVANLVCSVENITSVGMNLVGLARESLEVLSLDKRDLKILAQDLHPELEANAHLFDLQKA